MAQQTKKTKIASSTKNPMMQSDSLCVLNTCHMPNVLHSPPGGDEPGHSGDVAVHSVCVWGVHQWTRSPVPRLQTSQRLTPPLLWRDPQSVTQTPPTTSQPPRKHPDSLVSDLHPNVFFLFFYQKKNSNKKMWRWVRRRHSQPGAASAKKYILKNLVFNGQLYFFLVLRRKQMKYLINYATTADGHQNVF